MCFKTYTLGQTPKDVTVELSARVELSPLSIYLSWPSNSLTNQYQVYRKLKSATSWGPIIATLSGVETQFIDTSINEGVSYEYRVIRLGQGFNGYGYINSGIQIPATESRGILILLVESMLADSLTNEIKRLENDLIGDGWIVRKHIIALEESVMAVKDIIKTEYNKDIVNTKAVFLLGHIPVPYSGNLNPDGHPDHQGAWPADVFYADINGNWTDTGINNSIASDERNINTPGDGKFDQTVLPSDVELQIGRVDLSDMPAFTLSEIELTRNYLEKDHNYRHKKSNPVYGAVIDDNFGFFSGEAFAHSGWRNFVPLVGSENIESSDYFTTLSDKSYLWSYGCGGGSYTSAGGIGSTNNFASSDLQGVFTMLFGSYFGDWDNKNNFLRAPLAQGKALTSVWAGRPHWVLHHMGLGENIGYSVKLTQNNNALYHSNYGGRFIHIALIGDPTLRNNVVAPPNNLQTSVEGNNVILTWKPTTDSVFGYYVYMKNDSLSDYTRLNQNPIKDTKYTHECLLYEATYTYKVHAILLQITPSGTYFNLSQGIMDSIGYEHYLIVDANADYIKNGNEFSFTNNSTNATNYFWIFGDGNTSSDTNPTHTFANGNYDVKLIAYNECHADTITFSINILSNTNDEIEFISLLPNPTYGKVHINSQLPGTIKIVLYNSLGTKLKEVFLRENENIIDLTGYPKGLYNVRMESSQINKTYKLYLLE
jgi:hypothetical protein